MTRYKSRQSLKAVEKDFSHFVDMVVPLGALGKRLETRCTNFTLGTASSPSADMVGTTQTAACFADPATAAKFASEFDELRTT